MRIRDPRSLHGRRVDAFHTAQSRTEALGFSSESEFETPEVEFEFDVRIRVRDARVRDARVRDARVRDAQVRDARLEFETLELEMLEKPGSLNDSTTRSRMPENCTTNLIRGSGDDQPDHHRH